MSCEFFKQSIYLYDELSLSEKNLLDAHLQTCASCAALLNEVKNAQFLVRQVAEKEIVPRNAARLTHAVMSKISTEKKPQNSLPSISFFGRAKIALAVLSIFLLASFAAEFLGDWTQPKTTNDHVAGNAVVLNSTIFRENFSHGRVKHSLFADCRNSFKAGQNYLECLKSKLK